MGTCRRPSWTAMVCPTICGKMVLARLQVRMTFLSPFWFIASIFLSSFGWTNGPFFSDRDIGSLARFWLIAEGLSHIVDRHCLSGVGDTRYAISDTLTALLPSPLDNQRVGLLVITRLVAARRLAPGRLGPRQTDGLAAFAAAVRVVARA